MPQLCGQRTAAGGQVAESLGPILLPATHTHLPHIHCISTHRHTSVSLWNNISHRSSLSCGDVHMSSCVVASKRKLTQPATAILLHCHLSSESTMTMVLLSGSQAASLHRLRRTTVSQHRNAKFLSNSVDCPLERLIRTLRDWTVSSPL